MASTRRISCRSASLRWSGALGLFLIHALGGCALFGSPIPDPAARRAWASDLAAAAGFERLDSPSAAAGSLPVAAWARIGRTPGCVRVYLEGDGLAWRSRHRPSMDPTPTDPIGLKLALADRSAATLVYLARPCQYANPMGRSCRPLLWTAARYGDEILDATDERLDEILAPLVPREVTLVGFSGGGVVASLLAARRDDITRLITVAAPLDIDAWTQAQDVSPLLRSSSPMDVVDALRSLPQDHFLGLQDERVPPDVIERFDRALGDEAPSRVHRVPDASHLDWPGRWAALLDGLEPLCGDSGD